MTILCDGETTGIVNAVRDEDGTTAWKRITTKYRSISETRMRALSAKTQQFKTTARPGQGDKTARDGLVCTRS